MLVIPIFFSKKNVGYLVKKFQRSALGLLVSMLTNSKNNVGYMYPLFFWATPIYIYIYILCPLVIYLFRLID